MIQRFFAWAIVVFCSLSGYAASPSNGADYAIVFTLSRYIDNPDVLRQTVADLSIDFLPDAKAVNRILKQNGLNSIVFEGHLKDVLQKAEVGSFVLLEYQKSALNNSEFLLFEKKENILINYCIPDLHSHEIDSAEFITLLAKNYTGRAVITYKGAVPENISLLEGPTHPIASGSPNDTNESLEFLDYKLVDDVKLPTIINLWNVGNGNHKVKVYAPIENLSDKNIEITSVTGECRCISNWVYDRTIAPHKKGVIKFDFDPQVYADTGVIDTTFGVTMNGKIFQKIRIIGAIEHENSLIMDPVRIFDSFPMKSDGEPVKRQIMFFSNATEKLPLDVSSVSIPNEFCEITVHEKLPKNKFGQFSSVLCLDLIISPAKLEVGVNNGIIQIYIEYAGHKRIFDLPYTLIKN